MPPGGLVHRSLPMLQAGRQRFFCRRNSIPAYVGAPLRIFMSGAPFTDLLALPSAFAIVVIERAAMGIAQIRRRVAGLPRRTPPALGFLMLPSPFPALLITQAASPVLDSIGG